MNRLILLATCVLTCVFLGVPVGADDPPKRLTPDERKELEAKRDGLMSAGFKAYQAGKYPEATNSVEEALNLARQLYPRTDFPEGHDNLAESQHNLGFMLLVQGKFAAAEPLLKDALEMRKRLHQGDHPTVISSLNALGGFFREQGRSTDAEPLFLAALEMTRRLYKSDHPNVADTLNNLGLVLQARGKLTDAEPLFKDALDMNNRLYRGDHPRIALTLTNLGGVFREQGKLTETERLYREAFEMRKRLFKGDHPAVANGRNNLAFVLRQQGKYAEAEPLFRAALDMNRRLYTGDHPNVALSLQNLAMLTWDQEQRTDAERLLREAMEMQGRLFKSDHPDVAHNLHCLGVVLQELGKYADATPLLKDALEMRIRMFKGDHPDVARSRLCLAGVLHVQGNMADATSLFREALATSRRLVETYAKQRTEGETLTLTASLSLYRDALLSHELDREATAVVAYPQVWADKGFVARVYELRHQQARAAATNPRATAMLAELADVRRRRAHRSLPATKDPPTLKQRHEEIENHDNRIEKLARELKPLLPTIERADKLAAAQPGELQKVLPADVAVVDFLRFVHFEQDKDVPGKKGQKRTARYLAFIVTRDRIAWVDLDVATSVELAIATWRAAITSGKEVPDAIPRKVRELVWEKVRKELSVGIETVYVSPDAALCRIPWAALPGDKPGTILLEDFAVATIPHVPFLLDKLWPQDPLPNPPPVGSAGPVGRPDTPAGALVVGGVNYDADQTPNATPTRGEPLVKPGQKLGWGFLDNTVGEAHGVVALALSKKFPVARLNGDKATASAVLAALPRAKFAHFATHGFFADASFRSVFQLDEKDYEQSRLGERIGRAANSPLVMTGLVFAGANNPKMPGRGILTGEALIDLDLSGLELAVLSACETGLGDVAGGEGTFGLQRAFHIAGTRDVVASLWKVPDQSTAALMALFYKNLWEQTLSPMESLRQAQLEIYRHPDKISELAKGFRGKFEEVPGSGSDVVNTPGKDGKAQPLLWAAFMLSGSGR